MSERPTQHGQMNPFTFLIPMFAAAIAGIWIAAAFFHALPEDWIKDWYALPAILTAMLFVVVFTVFFTWLSTVIGGRIK